MYASDWNTSRKACPGKGVAAFIHDKWRGRWIPIVIPEAPTESRVWLIGAFSAQLLVCVFYAPQAGHLLRTRVAFYTALRQAWRLASSKYPAAKRVLAGDCNLPELQFSDQGGLCPAAR